MALNNNKNITVLIPVIEQHDLTARAVEVLEQTRVLPDTDVFIVDNNSLKPYAEDPRFNHTTIFSSNVNLGLVKSLTEMAPKINSDIIVYTHNDVLIHEQGWDKKILDAFNQYQLGMAGFFGAYGVDKNGGRIGACSNMLGKEWGSHGRYHGALLTSVRSASTLDGLGLIFNTDVLRSIDIPELPPHHWYDRILPLIFIEAGYRVATIGVGFDHRGGATSGGQGYTDFANKWCKENGRDPSKTGPDAQIYDEGWKIFQRDWAPKLPLVVDEQWNYRWLGR